MTPGEKLRYHHVHPAKLGTDAVFAIMAAVLLWQQHLLRAIAVGIAPPLIASLLVIRFANLENMKQSPLGRYVGAHMTMAMECIKLIGVVMFWGAAWYRSVFYCVVGLLVIAFAWMRGRLSESSTRTRTPR
jgi:hypothetical protein